MGGSSVQRMSLRALNRTFLHRQHLASRCTGPAEDVVGRLVAVQAQEPNWMHVSLAARVAGLTRDAVGELAERRVLVRTPLLRGTQHLVTADDYPWLRPTAQPALDRLARSSYYADARDLDVSELVAAARDVLGEQPVLRKDLGAALADRFPGRRPGVLAAAVEALVPVVHDPGTSSWGSWWSRRSIGVADGERWLGRPTTAPDVARLVRRYLAAFGPAGVMDVQAWSGLTRLREVVDGMRGELRTVRGLDGVELLDVPDGDVVDEDAPAPVRFLGAFDNAVLGHRDRRRVLPEDVRRDVMPGWSMVHATVLVDGFVAATWEVDGDDVVVRPVRALTDDEAGAVLEEGATVPAFTGLAGGVRIAGA